MNGSNEWLMTVAAALVAIFGGSCPLQNPHHAAGCAQRKDVKTAVTDAADCKAGTARMLV